jgi:hypothetical protein
MAENIINEQELERANDLIKSMNLQMQNLQSGSTEFSKSLVKQNQNFADMLSTMKAKQNLTKKDLDMMNQLVDAVKNIKDGSKSINELISLRNKALNEGNKTGAATYNIEIKRQRVQKLTNEAIDAADTMTGGMAGKLKSALETMREMGPAMGILTVMLTSAVALLLTFNQQQRSIADQFGAMGMTRFGDDLKSANEEMLKMGFEAGETQKAISDLANNFGKSVPEAAAMAKEVSETAKALGLSLDEATNLFGLFTEINGLSVEQSKNLMKSAQSLAQANNVAPDQILKDIAKDTSIFAKMTKDGGENLVRAAIQARKLGLELSDIAEISSNMLDFQTSLQNEVEASLMIGKQLNFQEARKLFLNKEYEKGMESVLNQLGGQVEFNKLNQLEQEAVAKAAGTTVVNMTKLLNKEKDAAKVAGELKKQTLSDLVPENALTNLDQLILTFKSLGVQIANTLGPALNTMMGMFAGIAKFLEPIISNVYVLGTALTLLTAKMIINTTATLANSLATIKNLFTRKGSKTAITQENMALGMNTMAENVNTTATGVNTTTEAANTAAKAANTTATGTATAVEGGLSTAKGVSTAATGANTLATNANTAAKSRGIVPTLSAFAANAANAVANFFAGAAKGSAKTFGIGALILVPIALMAIAAMVGAISQIGSAVDGFKATGDLMSMAGGKERAIATPGGLHLMNAKDDIMAAPGLAKFVANGGGGVNGQTDTSRLESKQNETNSKLERVASVLEGALAGPRPALARAMGSSVGDTVGNMA